MYKQLTDDKIETIENSMSCFFSDALDYGIPINFYLHGDKSKVFIKATVKISTTSYIIESLRFCNNYGDKLKNAFSRAILNELINLAKKAKKQDLYIVTNEEFLVEAMAFEKFKLVKTSNATFGQYKGKITI